EKVARERQMQLLRELKDEDKLTREREVKKQTQNHEPFSCSTKSQCRCRYIAGVPSRTC
ncbi:hypothetical protein DFH29DRAFT_815905, partial [Suillus ampliporus]